MLESGQQVMTPDGRSGRIVTAVAHAAADAYAAIDENQVVVRTVLLPGGEVRWYANQSLTPLTWDPPAAADADEPRGAIHRGADEARRR